MPATVVEAVIARLADQLPGGIVYTPSATIAASDIPVYDGYLPDQPVSSRYVVVFGGAGTRTSETICGTSDELSNRIQTTCIAWGDGALLGPMCRWLAGKVRDALTDWAPVADEIAGAAPLRHDLSIQPTYGETVASHPAVSAVDQFTIAGTF